MSLFYKCRACGQLSTKAMVRCCRCHYENNDVIDGEKLTQIDAKQPMIEWPTAPGAGKGVFYPAHILLPECVMFGTFKAEPKAVDIEDVYIKIANISPNNRKIRFKYDIKIPFNEIQELMYCSDPTLPLICLKPTKASNDKIQEKLFLGNPSVTGFKFDINSENPSERYIIIVFNATFSDQLTEPLNRWIQMHDKDVKCEVIDRDRGRLLLRNSQKGCADQPSQQLTKSAEQTYAGLWSELKSNTSNTGDQRIAVYKGIRRERRECETVLEVEIRHYFSADVVIIDVDVGGKYVKILNKGCKEISLNGWQLKRDVGVFVIAFKFEDIAIKPNEKITVWSCDCSARHCPPEHLVMNGLIWFTARSMRTTICNADGEEMATRIDRQI